MEWQAWGVELTELLGLSRSPVAVTYTDEPLAAAAAPACRPCTAIHQASAGAILQLNKENAACPGGAVYLGLAAPDPARAPKLRDFLIHGEKLFACPAAIFRSQRLGPPAPLGMAHYVLMAPLAQAPLGPDVTIVLCNAAQAARLVSLAYFETGEPMSCDPTGATCRSVITYPLVMNRVNISFGDITERRTDALPPELLYVSLPWTHLRSVVASLERCAAGRAEMDWSRRPE